MQSLTSRYLRRAANESINCLTLDTHEGYQTCLSKIENVNWYSLSGGYYEINGQRYHIRDWNEKYRQIPENYTRLNNSSIPDWLNIDVILSQHKWGQWQILSQIAKRLQVPLIQLEHTLPIDGQMDFQIQQCKSMRGDINVFISEYNKSKWQFDEIPNTKVIYHGIDTETFKPDPNKKRENVVFSCVNDWKNRDVFCGYKLWEQTIQGLPYRVMGDNPGLSSPSKNIEDLVDAYQTSRIFYCTAEISPVSTALLEAASCGCAIVANNTCCLPEFLVNGENAFVSRNEKELRKYLELLLKDEELANKMGKAARKTIEERFGLERFVSDWKSLLEEVSSL